MYIIFLIIAVIAGIIIALVTRSTKQRTKIREGNKGKDNTMTEEDMLAAALWDDDINLFNNR